MVFSDSTNKYLELDGIDETEEGGFIEGEMLLAFMIMRWGLWLHL